MKKRRQYRELPDIELPREMDAKIRKMTEVADRDIAERRWLDDSAWRGGAPVTVAPDDAARPADDIGIRENAPKPDPGADSVRGHGR